MSSTDVTAALKKVVSIIGAILIVGVGLIGMSSGNMTLIHLGALCVAMGGCMRYGFPDMFK